MDVAGRIELVRELCSFERRLTGTDAERRAANEVAERVRGLGRRAEVEPIYVHPQSELVHATHAALGVAGSLVAVGAPAVGFAIVLAAATSMYLDLDYRLYLLRSLFFRRASQNVVCAGPHPGRPRLILCAHLDAGRGGTVFAPAVARRWARVRRRLPWLGPYRIVFWSLALLLPLLGARMAGADSVAISALQLPLTLVLLAAAFALAEIRLSPVTPGAGDNASGVATAISLAGELDAAPPKHLDVWLLITAGGESDQEGMRAFLRSHRETLDPARTWFLALEALGGGEPRYEAAAGWITTYDLDRRLVEICDAIASADRDGERRYRAAPLRHGEAGDSMPPRVARMRSIGLTCRDADGAVPHRRLPGDVPAAIDPAALERAHGFALELVRRLDGEVERLSGADSGRLPRRRRRRPAGER